MEKKNIIDKGLEGITKKPKTEITTKQYLLAILAISIAAGLLANLTKVVYIGMAFGVVFVVALSVAAIISTKTYAVLPIIGPFVFCFIFAAFIVIDPLHIVLNPISTQVANQICNVSAQAYNAVACNVWKTMIP
jgi:hypothetical protein